MFGRSPNEKLAKEVSELRESVERIEHAFKMLQTEWTETYDKFRQLHWRVAKRQKAIEEAEAKAGDAAPATGLPGTEAGGGEKASGLTPSQLQHQMRILATRRRA